MNSMTRIAVVTRQRSPQKDVSLLQNPAEIGLDPVRAETGIREVTSSPWLLDSAVLENSES